jgi:ABC-type cobalamin transport system ATPase subunit
MPFLMQLRNVKEAGRLAPFSAQVRPVKWSIWSGQTAQAKARC